MIRAAQLTFALLFLSGCGTARFGGGSPGHVRVEEVAGFKAGPTVVVLAGGRADQEFPLRSAHQITNWPLQRGRLISITVDSAAMPHDISHHIRLYNPDWVVELREDSYHPRPGLDTQGGTVLHRGAAAEARAIVESVNTSIKEPQNHFRIRGSDALPQHGAHSLRLISSARKNITPTREWRASMRIRQHRVMMHALLLKLGMLAPAVNADQFLPSTRRKIAVAIYDGEGGGNPMPFCTDLMKGLPGLEAYPLSPEEMRNGALGRFDVALFPGGMASHQFDALGADGRGAVQEFVRAGGGYVGICAGAYMAAIQPYQWGLDLLDAQIVDHDHWARGIGPVKIELSKSGKKLFGPRTGPAEYHYGNGPILAPGGKAAIPDYEVLAWYRTGIGRNGADPKVMINTPAIVRGHFGKGRVLVSSGHAEWSSGIESFLLRYVEWAAGRKQGVKDHPTPQAAP